jgi:hypothetical protein
MFGLLAALACSEPASDASSIAGAPSSVIEVPAPPHAAPAPAPAPAAGLPEDRVQPPRVVAVGDIHGDPAALQTVLAMAALVDDAGHWTGGRAVLVQTGDSTDRGPDSRGVLAMLRALEAEARAAGGDVVPLLGNHEVMNMQGDWRYVSPADLASYGGEAPRKAAFAAEGEDGRWLRGLDAVALVEGTVFCHGGVDANWARRGVEELNLLVRAGIDSAAVASRVPGADVLGPDGPLWNRAFLLEDEPAVCPELDGALAALGADRMVVGHTTQDSGRVGSRCAGKLWGIDTGISAHYGNHYAAIEIVGDTVRELLPPTP